METIRQVVQVNSDRKVEITLPETIEPGLVEVVLVVQSLDKSLEKAKAQSDEEIQSLHPNHLFGFLPRRVEPTEFQRELRNEWNQ